MDTPRASLCDSEQFTKFTAGLLAARHAVRFRPRGRSMAPLIRSGEAITIRAVAPSDLRAGDVALFVSSTGGMIAHRVLAVRIVGHWAGLYTKGDAAARPDPLVPLSNLMGRVTRIEKPNGVVIDLERPLWRGLGRMLAWSALVRILVHRTVRPAWVVIPYRVRWRLHACLVAAHVLGHMATRALIGCAMVLDRLCASPWRSSGVKR
jgi:signal peptidase I